VQHSVQSRAEAVRVDPPIADPASQAGFVSSAMRRLGPYAWIVAIALIVLLLPLALSSGFYYRIAALVFINALAVLGLNLLMGFAGQVSLGHAGFFGIGAYAVALAPTHLGLPSWLALVGGIAIAGLLAFVVGRPILRLKGYYLAVATLGMGLLIAMVFSNETAITNGPNGMPVPRLELFGWRLTGPVAWYWISGATLVLGTWVAVPCARSTTASWLPVCSASTWHATSC
jgi:branched-chain amino acid transport system permease protein